MDTTRTGLRGRDVLSASESCVYSQYRSAIRRRYPAPHMGARPQHSPEYRKFCRLLRQWREEAGLTQRVLAGRLRKPPSFVHKVEVADRRIDPLEFVRWCQGCDIVPERALSVVKKEVVGG